MDINKPQNCGKKTYQLLATVRHLCTTLHIFRLTVYSEILSSKITCILFFSHSPQYGYIIHMQYIRFITV